MKQRERLLQSTVDLHREITRERLTRRDLLKLGLLSGATGLLLPISGLSLRAAWAKDGGSGSSGSNSGSGSGSSGGSSGSCAIPAPFIGQSGWFTNPMPRLFEMTPLSSGIAGISGPTPGPHPVAGTNDSKLRCVADFPSTSGQWGLDKTTPYADLAHQAWADPNSKLYFPPVDFYELRAVQHNHRWHSQMPAGSKGQPAWGFAPPGFDETKHSIVPGPVFRTRYGRSHFVRIHNDLPATPVEDQVSPLGFGTPIITTHMHNLHTPAESDGNPLFWNYPGHFYDYHYPNVYAGVNQYGGIGDPREALGTLWYHDHKLDFTAQNVYAGLAGLNCIYDDLDAGDPTESTGLRLPCGDNYEFDVPLVFHDRAFDTRGVDYFPLACFDGAIGQDYTVNGVIRPYFDVSRRKYRFRLLDMGPSRFYWWFLQDSGGNNIPYTVIANDGNLLPAPVAVSTGVKQAVAERWDIVIDFSKFKPGDKIYLVNRAEQVDGRGPTGNLLRPGIAVLQFRVGGAPARKDNSMIPAKLRDLPDPVDLATAKRQTWTFKRSGGAWAVRGEPVNINLNTNDQYDRFATPYQIPEGTAEQWTIVNGGGSWSHPVHIHYEEHRFLGYNGTAPSPTVNPTEYSRKDVIRLDPNAKVEIAMRFRDYKGIYPMHCHNVVHEDHAMMIMWKIV